MLMVTDLYRSQHEKLTGSCHFLEVGGLVLIDCGMEQGNNPIRMRNFRSAQ